MAENQLALDLIKTNLMLQMQFSLNEFAAYCQKNEVMVSNSFCSCFQALLKKGSTMQMAGTLGEVAYLAISVLRTFIMASRYQLRLDLYDASYFLSKVECSAYLDADYILKFIDSDIDALVGDLKRYGGKINSIEADQLKKDYIDAYSEVVKAFISQNIQTILALKEYSLLQKAPDFKIIYGEYLDRTVTLYEAEK
jgi:hypothetical protein